MKNLMYICLLNINDETQHKTLKKQTKKHTFHKCTFAIILHLPEKI